MQAAATYINAKTYCILATSVCYIMAPISEISEASDSPRHISTPQTSTDVVLPFQRTEA